MYRSLVQRKFIFRIGKIGDKITQQSTIDSTARQSEEAIKGTTGIKV